MDPLAQPRLRALDTPASVVVRSFPELPGVELWSVRGYQGRWTAYHPSYLFSSLDPEPEFRGTYQWKYRRATYAAARTSTFLVEPDEMFVTTNVSEPASFHAVLVAPEMVDRELGGAASGAAAHRHFLDGKIDDAAVYERFQRLWATMEKPGADAGDCEHHLRRYLSMIFERAGEQPPAPPATGCERAVKTARQFIEENYAQRLSLEAVSEAATLSKYHLERSFGSKVGLPVWEFVKHVRIRHAMRMLRQGLRPSQVASRTGFSDQAHMTRMFRDLLGFTPGHYHAAYFAARRGDRRLASSSSAAEGSAPPAPSGAPDHE